MVSVFWYLYFITGVSIGTGLWLNFSALLPDLEKIVRKDRNGFICMVAILWPIIILLRV